MEMIGTVQCLAHDRFFYNCWFDLGRRMKIFYVDGVIEAKTERSENLKGKS